MSSRRLGKVKWFNTEKGYGFILSPDGDDVFVHYRAIMFDGFKKLREGEMVSYLQVKSEKGWQAAEVEPISSEDESEISQHSQNQSPHEQVDENPNDN